MIIIRYYFIKLDLLTLIWLKVSLFSESRCSVLFVNYKNFCFQFLLILGDLNIMIDYFLMHLFVIMALMLFETVAPLATERYSLY